MISGESMFKDIDINALIAMLDQTDIRTVRIKSADFELELSREHQSKFESGNGNATLQTLPLPSPAQANDANLGGNGKVPPLEILEDITSPPVLQAPGAVAGNNDQSIDDHSALHILKAPLVGVFYRSSAPGAPPFVELDQKVDPETTIGLLETMKVFTAIQAGKHGIVKEILAGNGQVVELDAPILVIEEI